MLGHVRPMSAPPGVVVLVQSLALSQSCCGAPSPPPSERRCCFAVVASWRRCSCGRRRVVAVVLVASSALFAVPGLSRYSVGVLDAPVVSSSSSSRTSNVDRSASMMHPPLHTQ